jgi:hypothetical protein
VGALALVLSLAVASTALAQQELQTVEYFLYAGQALLESGDYHGAVGYLRKAHDKSGDWRILYDIARCEAKLKHHGVAVEIYRRYLAEGGSAIDERRRAEVEGAIENLTYECGFLAIEAPEGETLLVDGIERGKAPLPGPILVTAGVEHTVSTKKGATRRVTVEFGRTEDVDLTRAKVAGEEPPEEEVERKSSETVSEPKMGTGKGLKEESTPMRKTGVALSIIGGSILALSAVTGFAAIGKDKELEKVCVDKQCGSSWSDELDTRDNLATTTNVFWGVGGAALVTGIVLVIVDSKRETKRAGRMQLRGELGAGRAALSIGMAF